MAKKSYPLCTLAAPVGFAQLNQSLGAFENAVLLLLVKKPSRSTLALHASGNKWVLSEDEFIKACRITMFYLLKWDSDMMQAINVWFPGVKISSGCPGDCFYGSAFELIKVKPFFREELGYYVFDFAI